jgi:predicted aconitase
MLTMSDLFKICCRYTALDEKLSTLNVDIVAYLCNIVSPVFGAEDSGMKVDSVFASVKIWFWLLSENVV